MKFKNIPILKPLPVKLNRKLKTEIMVTCQRCHKNVAKFVCRVCSKKVCKSCWANGTCVDCCIEPAMD